MLDEGYDSLLERWKNNELTKHDYLYIADTMKVFEGSVEYKILKSFIESQIYRIHAYPKKAEDHSYLLGKMDGLAYIKESIKMLQKYAEFATKKEKEEEPIDIPLSNERASIE